MQEREASYRPENPQSALAHGPECCGRTTDGSRTERGDTLDAAQDADRRGRGRRGGLELVRRLGARFGRERHDIILVEKNRTHIWKPLLHEVAAGALDANLDEVGYRSHCHRWGYRYLPRHARERRPRARR
jgi:hypothetical protein